MPVFAKHLARERLKHVAAIIEYPQSPHLCTLVFDMAHRDAWMAFGKREFDDLIVGNEWNPGASQIGKNALGLDIRIGTEDIWRYANHPGYPALAAGEEPATLYQMVRQKADKGEIPRYSFPSDDPKGQHAVFDAIDAVCVGESKHPAR